MFFEKWSIKIGVPVHLTPHGITWVNLYLMHHRLATGLVQSAILCAMELFH